MIYVQRKVYKSEPVIANAELDLYISGASFSTQADVDQLLSLPGFKKINSNSFHIQRTVVAGNVILDNMKLRIPVLLLSLFTERNRGTTGGESA